MSGAFDGILDSMRVSYARSEQAISQSMQAARALRVRAVSPNGRVVVELADGYRVRAIEIGDDEFNERDADGLSDAVLAAYGVAAAQLRIEQRRVVLGSVLSIDRREHE